MIENAVDELAPIVGTTAGRCWPSGLDRAEPGTAVTGKVRYLSDQKRSPRPSPGRSRAVERKHIKAILESDEFVDEAPATVYAKLLDQGTYLGVRLNDVPDLAHERRGPRASAPGHPSRRTRNPS